MISDYTIQDSKIAFNFALKLNEFVKSKEGTQLKFAPRFQHKGKNLTIKDKNLATRIKQAVKKFSAVKILPNFHTLKNNRQQG